MRASRKTHPAHRHFERSFSGVIQCAEFSELANRYLRVVVSASVLHAADPFDASPHVGGSCPAGAAAQLLIRHCGHFDVQIDAVKQRTADLPQITLNDPAGAAAFPRRIRKMPAGAYVRVTNALPVRNRSAVRLVVDRAKLQSRSSSRPAPPSPLSNPNPRMQSPRPAHPGCLEIGLLYSSAPSRWPASC